MKKSILTLAIVLGMSVGAFAQEGGLFGYGFIGDNHDWKPANWYASQTWTRNDNPIFNLPGSHGQTTDYYATPLSSGALLLIGFGAAYAMKNRVKKE